MRLIDAEALLEKLKWLDEYDYIVFDAVKRNVDEVPTVEAIPVAELPYTVWLTHDVVQVVRCKDCKWHEDEEPGSVWCPHVIGSWVKSDGYCFLGERKE